jgi:hypothetical protein
MMAEQDYSKLNLLELDKLITDLVKQQKEVAKKLNQGYDYMNVGGSRVKIDIPQFSSQYDSLMNQGRQLEQQIQVLTGFAKAKADVYKPLVGPTNKLLEKENSIAKKYRAAVPVPASEAPQPASSQPTIPIATVALPPTVAPAIAPTVPASSYMAPVKTTDTTKEKATSSGKVAKTAGGGTAETATFQVGDWQAILQSQYPGYSKDWLASNALDHFGQDMINLMVEASKLNGKYLGLTTQASVDAFKKDLKQTVYWTTTETSAKKFDELLDVDKKRLVDRKKLDIANSYGDVSFDEATLTQLATNAARLGLTDLSLQQAVYAGALKPGAGGSQTALAGRVLQGADADRIRSIGRAYNFKVSDAQVQSILTGTPEAGSGQVLTEEGLRQRLQKYVRGAMPQLADQIDAGLSLEDIGGNYRRYAADLLERSEDEIDMFSGPYLKAFGSKDGGQLSLSEWVTTVKSDPSFGWQYTKQANQQATDIALSLARAFGKVG